jgi:deoxyuridine 5'-triphosphate nucleotidohydrolase
MKLKVKKLHPNAILPTKNHESDAGIDLYALEDTEIDPGCTVKVRTGIAIQPEHSKLVASLVWDRSGLGSKGIHRVAGVIDQTYTGELVVCLTNLNIGPVLKAILSKMTCGDTESLIGSIYQYTYVIKQGDKIAQILIQEIVPTEIVEEELNVTIRGDKGFGSSGT